MPLDLVDIAAECDAETRAARTRLIDAVRQAAASGMTQQQIGAAIGRSQPEVSRLLHFHGTSALGRRLRAARPQILRLIRAAHGTNVRVFGSVATGEDDAESDIDLLFTMATPLSLMDLERLQRELSLVVSAEIDLIPESSLRPALRDRVLAQAVPL